MSLENARQKVEIWRREYNNERPHSTLGQMVPAQFARTKLIGAEAAG
ncbi:transposase [Dehalococcoides mccartyi]|nr:transposase [Dehalococcoides mccartyi]